MIVYPHAMEWLKISLNHDWKEEGIERMPLFSEI